MSRWQLSNKIYRLPVAAEGDATSVPGTNATWRHAPHHVGVWMNCGRDLLATSFSDWPIASVRLANELSLTSQGIRFYEESRLIAPARVGRTRVFNYQDRARLVLIQRLRGLGSAPTKYVRC
jgi:hypothetical protein